MSMPDKDKSYGSETGSSCFYVVEARLTNQDHARMVNGVLLTREWVRLPTTQVPSDAAIEVRRIGVPAAQWPRLASEHGLLEREAAYAFAVRFQVDSGIDERSYTAGHAVLCVETRLVEVKLSWTYSMTEIGVCAPFSLFEHLRFLKSSPRELTPKAEQAIARAEGTGV